MTYFAVRLVQYAFASHLVVVPVADVLPAGLLVPGSLAVAHAAGPKAVILLAPISVVLDSMIPVITLIEISLILRLAIRVEFGPLPVE